MKKLMTGILVTGMALSMAFPALATTRPCDDYEACAVKDCNEEACHEHDGHMYRGTCSDGACEYHREDTGRRTGGCHGSSGHHGHSGHGRSRGCH